MAGKNKPKATSEAKAANLAASSKNGKRPPKPPKRKVVKTERRQRIEAARAHLNECAVRLSEAERELRLMRRGIDADDDKAWEKFEASPELLVVRVEVQAARAAKERARRLLSEERQLPIPEQPRKAPRQWVPKDYLAQLAQKEAVPT